MAAVLEYVARLLLVERDFLLLLKTSPCFA